MSPSKPTTGQIVLSVLSAIALFFGLADVPEQAVKWQTALVRLWTAFSPFMTSDLGRWVLVIAAVIVLVAAWWPRTPGGASRMALATGHSPNESAASQVQSKSHDRIQPKIDGRVYLNRTPAELTSLAQGHTSYQRKNIVAPYAGKWVVVDAELSDIRPLPNHFEIEAFESAQSGRERGVVLHLQFDASAEEQLGHLRIGDRLKVAGVLNDIMPHGL
jgi:hypothetical protein